MKEYLTPVVKQQDEGCKGIVKVNAFSASVDFNASSSSELLKWTDLEQNTLYRIVSTRAINTQHGQSVILSLQKADGSCCSAWACGVDEIVVAKPYGDGELAVICAVNRAENEQEGRRDGGGGGTDRQTCYCLESHG